MADRLEEIQILLQKRIARSRGPTSSKAFNDSIDEISHDLASFSDQWTNRLVPLTSTIPNGTVDSTCDAFLNGLDGRTLYVHHESTASLEASYYNTVKGRPNTIYEQLKDVYQSIELLQEDLEGRIDDLITSASMVAVLDNGSLYDSVNVEDALAEVMAKVNLLALGGLDISAVAQPYLPAIDNSYDIGSTAKRVRSLYLGTSLHINSKVSDPSNPPAKNFQWKINSTTGKLELYDGATVVARYSSTGAEFPQGGGSISVDDLVDVDITGVIPGQVLKYDGANWVNGTDIGALAAGTTGSVQFKDAAGELDGGTELFWDIANERLGIGTNSPTKKLHVQHDVAGSAQIRIQNDQADALAEAWLQAYTSHTNDVWTNIINFNASHAGLTYARATNAGVTLIQNAGTGAGGMYFNTEGAFRWLRPTEAASITSLSDGKFGIGKDTPVEKLEVAGGLKIAAALQATAGTITWDGSNFKGYDGAEWKELDVGVGSPGGSDKQIQFNNGGAFAGASNLYWHEGNDRLGIGIDDPTGHIHLQKDDNSGITQIIENQNAGDSAFAANWVGSDTCWGYIGAFSSTSISSLASESLADALVFTDSSSLSCSKMLIGTDSSSPLHLFTDSKKRLTVLDDGRIGIGTDAPDETLHVVSGIKIGSAVQSTAGTIQWNGSHFQGYNGAGWVDLDIAVGGILLDDLADVTMGGTVSGQTLMFNGTSWGNEWAPEYLQGAGQQDYVAIWNGTNNLGWNPAFYWDSTYNRLGIGTVTPGEPLEVYVDQGSWDGIRVHQATTSGTEGGLIHILRSRDGGSTETDDNVGAFGFKAINSTSGVFNVAEMRSVATDTTSGVEAGDIRFFTMDDGDWGERIRFTSDGKVGIGTDDPSCLLEVDGNISSPGTGTDSEKFGLNSVASGLYATAIGKNADAGNYSTAIGFGTTAGNFGTSLGYNATATGENTLALGRLSSATGIRAIAVGVNALCGGDYSFAAGYLANCTGGQAVAIGNGANAYGQSIAIGNAAGNATAGSGVAIGYSANLAAGSFYSTALGWNADCNSSYCTSLGYETYTAASGATAIGWAAECHSINALAIGGNAEVHESSDYGTAIGFGATVSGLHSIAIGRSAVSTADNDGQWGSETYPISFNMYSDMYVKGNITSPGSTATSEKFGLDASADANYATAMGNSALADFEGSTAIGYQAEATSSNAVVIGRDSTAGATGISIGWGATAGNNVNVAIGRLTTATGDSATALGLYASAEGYRGVALGAYADAGSLNGSIAIGQATATGTQTVSIGYGTTATSVGYSVALGGGAYIASDKNYSTALGFGARVEGGTSCVAVGTYAKTYGDGGAITIGAAENYGTGSVALGYQSKIWDDSQYCIAIGKDTSIGTNAIGNVDYSIAIGLGATIENNVIGGLAIGRNCRAADDYSIALGYGTTAVGSNEGQWGNPTYPVSFMSYDDMAITGDVTVSGECHVTEKIGIGVTDPDEALEVNGAVHIGTTANTNEGTIRYTGTDFEGYTVSGWQSLTGGGGGGGGASVLNDLTDVSLSSPASGEHLIYNGTQWTNTESVGEGGAPELTVTDVKTTTYTASINEVVRCDPSGGGFEVDLPESTTGNKGQTIIVKNTVNSTNTITIDPNLTQLIDGQSEATITEAYRAITLISYGNGWGII